MKRSAATCYLLLITLTLLCPGIRSQGLVDGAAGERLQVSTDRTLYVAGEKCFFSAVLFHVPDILGEQFSHILYCELITPDGKKVASRKYTLENSSAEGCFIIPEETISGIYFLKFYTRFMRNLPTDQYKYVMLKIVNPFKTEVLPGTDVADTVKKAGTMTHTPSGIQTLNILPVKKSFSPREEIRLSIAGSSRIDSLTRICFSVVPESTCDDRSFVLKNSADSGKNEVYIPETRTLSLSGKLIGRETGKPVPNAVINLSIIGDKDILVVRTDSSGRFFFALPDYTGSRDIFLSADDLPGIKPEVLIDNDFCSKPVNLPSPIFTLNEEEMNAAYKLAVNSRITAMFREEPKAGDTVEAEAPVSFYGKPTEVFYMDKYIDLPKFEDYFAETPIAVKLRKIEGKKHFVFYNTHPEMTIYDPLVLVDWVAVNDMDKILAMSPLEIARIELVSSLYVKGNIIYGGIISFVSKKNNFAGIDLPSSGTFVNYKFLDDCAEQSPSNPASLNMPDSRNTVYWNPEFRLNSGDDTSVSFLAPDTPGRYCILLRELGPAGEKVLASETILVTGK